MSYAIIAGVIFAWAVVLLEVERDIRRMKRATKIMRRIREASPPIWAQVYR